MEHHHHHHHHTHSFGEVKRAFVWGIVLNITFIVVEVGAGLYYHSLSLLTDAGHNLADVASLALSLLAFRMMRVKPTAEFTYGLQKSSVLVALFNSVLLLVSVGAIGVEAIQRFFHPAVLSGFPIAVVAGVGIVINGITALLFHKDQHKDLNIKSAYYHLLADAAVSLVIVLGGIIIIYTEWYWVDTVLSLGVAGVILFSTWKLLKDSLRMSLDAVPSAISVQEIHKVAMQIVGVKDLHHIHVWSLSTTDSAMTAHLVLDQNTTRDQEKEIRHTLKHKLEHLSIQHVTLETEWENEECLDDECR